MVDCRLLQDWTSKKTVDRLGNSLALKDSRHTEFYCSDGLEHICAGLTGSPEVSAFAFQCLHHQSLEHIPLLNVRLPMVTQENILS